MENQLTYESIDARLIDILKETDDLFQSGQLTFPDETNKLYNTLMTNKSNECQVDVLKNQKENILSEKDNEKGICIINGFPNEELPQILQPRHQTNNIKFNQTDHDKQWSQFKTLEQGNDAGWTDWQKQVFYNYADKLKHEYFCLQRQLCSNFKVDLERNINFLRTQYTNTLCALQKDLIYLKTNNQNLLSKEAECHLKISKYETDLAHANKEIDRLQNELNDKKDEVGDYEYNNEEIKYSQTSLEDVLVERDRRISALEMELSSALNQLEQQHHKNEVLCTDLVQTNKEIDQTQKELANALNEIEKLKSDNERLLNVIKALYEKEDAQQKTHLDVSLLSKLDTLTLEKQALYDRIEEITTMYEKHISTCNRKINQLQNEIDSKSI